MSMTKKVWYCGRIDLQQFDQSKFSICDNRQKETNPLGSHYLLKMNKHVEIIAFLLVRKKNKTELYYFISTSNSTNTKQWHIESIFFIGKIHGKNVRILFPPIIEVIEDWRYISFARELSCFVSYFRLSPQAWSSGSSHCNGVIPQSFCLFLLNNT